MRKQLLFYKIGVFFLLAIPGLLQSQWNLSPVDTLITHAPGDTFSVDIHLSGSGPVIDAMGFDLHFPDSLIQPDSALLSETLLDPWMFKNVNLLEDDTYRVAGFTISDAIQPFMNGVLVRFRFVVQTQKRRTGIFTLDNFADDLVDATTVPDTFFIFTNSNPRILSAPETQAWEDSLYKYQVNAIDPDQDSLKYHLIQAPVWLEIDSTTGLIQGTPTNAQVGDTVVVLKVSDPFGGQAEQQYNLTVINVNDPPVITSKPVLTATQHTPYFYQVVASDPDPADVLQFALEVQPHWLTIDPDSGMVSGTPGAMDVGDTTVVIRVSDLAGATVRQQFMLSIIDVNDPPLIQSVPDTIAKEDSLYTYQIEAIDVDAADTLTFRFEIAPTWLQIDSISGLVQGTPTNENVGDTLVSIQVLDQHAGESRQQFPLHVLNVNDPPIAPVALLKPAWEETTAVAQTRFIWRQGADPDVGDVLLYSLEIYEDELLNLLKFQKTAIPDTFFAFASIPNHATLFENNQVYYWRVQTIDQAGAASEFTTPARFKFVGGGITDISAQNNIPLEFCLLPLYPNPFNPSVVIPFEIPRQSWVHIQIFNLQGQLLRTLLHEERPAGVYQLAWDGLNENRQMVSSGIYLVRFRAGNYHAIQKVTLIR